MPGEHAFLGGVDFGEVVNSDRELERPRLDESRELLDAPRQLRNCRLHCSEALSGCRSVAFAAARSATESSFDSRRCSTCVSKAARMMPKCVGNPGRRPEWELCRPPWPGSSSTYGRGKSVQTSGTTSLTPDF